MAAAPSQGQLGPDCRNRQYDEQDAKSPGKITAMDDNRFYWMKDFDKGFEPEVKEVLEARNQHKAGERNLGNDPKTGKPVFVKIWG